ncbi:MAG: 3-isopropylmalate dehydratase large subunit [Magnetococcus sp. DMHC-6]
MIKGSMGQTATEKIIAKHTKQSRVTPGEIVSVTVDRVFSHDIFATTVIREFQKIGKPLWRPQDVILIVDHDVPSTSADSGAIYQEMTDFAIKWGLKNFYYGEGVCHQLMPEKGHVGPGEIIIGTDSHTVTYGALGALATGVGSTEMAAIWSSGTIWLKVPETIRVVLSGALQNGVFAKDLILHLIGLLGSDGCTYKALEFDGPGVATLSMDERLTIANMVVEMGAKNGIFPVDDITRAYLSSRYFSDYPDISSDADAQFCRVISLDMSSISPKLSGPKRVDDIHDLQSLAGMTIHQGFIGSCTNGRLEDLRIAARILAGQSVAPFVKLIISPASRSIYLQAMDEGLIKIFLQAGGVVTNPGCGLCFGKLGGVLGAGEVAICSNNRNFPGRLGHPDAHIYLASPASVALSVITGKITSPISFFQGELERS